jgi:hypothetical protein
MLSPRSEYIGRYEDGPMGPYITAYVKTFGRKQIEGFTTMWLENFQQHLHEACPVKFLKSSMEMVRHARTVA